MIRSVMLVAMLMVVLSITACGGPGTQQSNAPSPGDDGTRETGASSDKASAASNGDEAPDFDLTTLEGDEFNLVHDQATSWSMDR